MDTDMAELIIHALIKQHRAGAQAQAWFERAETTEREENKKLTDGRSLEESQAGAAGEGPRNTSRWGFLCTGDSWAVNMQSLIAMRQSEERHSSTCCTVGRNPSERRGIMIAGRGNKSRACLLPQTDPSHIQMWGRHAAASGHRAAPEWKYCFSVMKADVHIH